MLPRAMPLRPRRPRRLVTVLVAAALAAGAAGCGSEVATSTKPAAESEANYLRLPAKEGLTYQIQLSRALDAKDPEDQGYLAGLPASEQRLAPNETWFAIFLRVQNETPPPKHPDGRVGTPDAPKRLAGNFFIQDSQQHVYRPVALPATNPFSYQPVKLGYGMVYPDPSSVAGTASPVQEGAMVLFKMSYLSLQNRPLVFTLRDDASGEQEAVDLDV